MNKKLVIVTTDMEIEAVLLVDVTRLRDTRDAIEKTKERYYNSYYYSDTEESFENVLLEEMNKRDIKFEFVADFEEM